MDARPPAALRRWPGPGAPDVVALLAAVLAMAPLASGCASPGRARETEGGDPRPSFVVVLVDDQGWAETSVPMLPEVENAACTWLTMPSLERLASEGMRFGAAYAPAPLCTPSRRSLLCGMNPAREHGTEFRSDFDPTAHLTLPFALKAVDARYRCAHFGKWGEMMGATPEECGYDESDGPTGTPDGDVTPDGTAGEDGGKPPLAVSDPKRTFSVTERALGFLDRRADDGAPFYLQVSTYALHRPVQARPETLRKYEDRGTPPRTFPSSFAAMTEDLDDALGRILDRLDSLGLADRTWVFYTSDNGGTEFDRTNPLYSEHSGTKGLGRGLQADAETRAIEPGETVRLPVNWPLRGSKQRLYEGGLRVPLVVRGPGVAADAVCRQPVVLTDLLPTVVDLAGGGDLPAEIDGADLAPALRDGGRGPIRRPTPGLVFHRPELGYSAYREGDLKLVVGWGGDGRPESLELYDVVADPGEHRDLAAERPEARDGLLGRLLGWLESVHAKMPAAGAR